MFVSWNLANFGKSKSPEAIETIAQVLRSADIVAVQEVSAGKNFGARAVATLKEALARTGSNWDYVVSDPTVPPSPGVERYAYLVKSYVRFSRDSAHLVSELEEAIDREPYALTVLPRNTLPIQLFTIHAVPTKKGPAREIEALSANKDIVGVSRAIVAGDFNLPARITDVPFSGIGYTGHIREKTSLKEKLDAQGGYLLHQYDNIYTKGITVCESGTIDFVRKHFAPVTEDSLRSARAVSDHLPVYIRFR